MRRTKQHELWWGPALLLALLVLGSGLATGQTLASYGQHVAIAKKMKPGLTTLGIFGSNLSDKMIEQISRAATGQGVKIVIAKPQDAGQVASFYNKLAGEKKVEMIWFPDPADHMILGIGFEFLREKAVTDKIGLIVPQESLVASGGLCTVLVDGGKLKVIVNQRIAQVIGLSVPAESSESVTFVSR
jgi:ABC-type uncharacterized transport system substrate-binding protein